MVRVGAGFVVGVVLGAALSGIAGPVGMGVFFTDFSSLGSVLLFLLALLSWVVASGIEALAARIAERFEIPMALLSVLIGTMAGQSLMEGVAFGLPALWAGPACPLFALFGGAMVYARRQPLLSAS